MPGMTKAEYAAGRTGVLTGTFVDTDGTAIPLARLVTLSLTVRNAHTGATVRTVADAKNTAGGVTVNADGTWAWYIPATDTTVGDSTLAEEHHVALLPFTYTDTSGATLSGEVQHELVCVPSAGLLLASAADVDEWLGGLPDGDWPLVERILRGVTRDIERHCGRRFAYLAAATEVFSALQGERWAFELERWPVASITSVKLEPFSNFAAATAESSSNYALFPEEGLVRLRYTPAFTGERVVQIVYAGGLFRETAAVDSDLRDAATIQAVFRYQRRGAVGVISESGAGGSISMEVERGKLLREVRERLELYRRVPFAF